MQDLFDFIQPIDMSIIHDDQLYTDGQLGKHIIINENSYPDIEAADLVIIGSNETRGNGPLNQEGPLGADIIRKHLYQLHYWHTDVRIADLGNIETGATWNDSIAAIKTICAELQRMNKTVILLGGSHDLTMAQYAAFKEMDKIIDATCIDAKIDLKGDSSNRDESFLLEMLTGEPNMVRHYNHIGFQSYYVHPRMIETMDKLRFDCYRLGVVREDIEEMEPVIRDTNLLSFDISAIRNSDAPANTLSANGLTGEEACTLTRYAGLSSSLSSLGFYGYDPAKDQHELTAKQIAQMIWYFIDGRYRSLQESTLDDRHNFNEYHTAFTEVDTLFLQSKRTQRWWMQLPDKKFTSCSFNDYVKASTNKIPERWLRIQERG